MGSRQPEVGARGRSPGRTVLGMASLCTGAPGRHQVWVRSRFRVTSGHTVSGPGELDYRKVKVK